MARSMLRHLHTHGTRATRCTLRAPWRRKRRWAGGLATADGRRAKLYNFGHIETGPKVGL
eukprot:scaffold81136_cov78-Phaeocystis_antarctica.AAC.1